MDYLADRLIASYFQAREHESYYRSLRHAESRRDFHEDIIPVLIDFICEVGSNSNPQAIDAVIGAAASARMVIRPTQDLVSDARRLHPVGFNLLQIDDDLTLENLKSLYRHAARRHHPDAGGSQEVMITVNEAYNLFHELLCQPQLEVIPTTDDGPSISSFEVPIETARDYAYVVGSLLLEIKLDEWSLDDAHYWLTTLISDEYRASAYAQTPQVRANLLFPCSTLAGRLWGAGMKEQALEVYEIAEGALRVAVENGLYHGTGLFEADKYLKKGQKLRVVLNHRRQAENALRLGLIDEKRYKQTIERLEGKSEKTDVQEEALRRYVSEVGFLQDLPTDRVAQGKVVRARLVPEPDYFDDRLEKLSDDQQAEYLRSFSLDADIRLVRKYTCLRLGNLLRTMILHDSEVDLPAIERESRFLATLQIHNAGYTCDRVADVARFLGDLEPADRGERCRILLELDQKSSEVMTTFTEFEPLTGWSEETTTDSTFMVSTNPNYLAIVLLPLDRLNLALRTGSTKTKVEEADENEVWDREVNLVNALRDENDYKTAWDALDRSKEDPEAVVRATSAYIEKLLENGETMVHAEFLNVGYWIDKLTIALTRLKRWEDAEAWLVRFFELPESYQKGSSPSEQEAMTKRLDRCRKMTSR